MISKKAMFSYSICMAALFGATGAVQAMQHNPLHPSYFVAKTAPIVVVQSPSRWSYSESSNPLHPSFTGSHSKHWESTAVSAGDFYIDRRNPLHPSYQRSF